MKIIKFLAASCLITTAVFATSPKGIGYNIGDKVNNFELKNVDGNTIALNDYKDKKGVIVIFTCNNCPYVKMWEDRIISLDKDYTSKGYPVVAINPNGSFKSDSFEKMKKRAKEKKYTFPYLQDYTQEVAKSFGASRTPHVFVLNKSGNDFKVAYIGAIDDNYKSANKVKSHYVEDAVNALITGGKPDTKMTRSIGCSIKWD